MDFLVVWKFSLRKLDAKTLSIANNVVFSATCFHVDEQPQEFELQLLPHKSPYDNRLLPTKQTAPVIDNHSLSLKVLLPNNELLLLDDKRWLLDNGELLNRNCILLHSEILKAVTRRDDRLLFLEKRRASRCVANAGQCE